jgi:hypothetical protein
MNRSYRFLFKQELSSFKKSDGLSDLEVNNGTSELSKALTDSLSTGIRFIRHQILEVQKLENRTHTSSS